MRPPAPIRRWRYNDGPPSARINAASVNSKGASRTSRMMAAIWSKAAFTMRLIGRARLLEPTSITMSWPTK